MHTLSKNLCDNYRDLLVPDIFDYLEFNIKLALKGLFPNDFGIST